MPAVYTLIGPALTAAAIPVATGPETLDQDAANFSYDLVAHALSAPATTHSGLLTLLAGQAVTGAHGESAVLTWAEELLTLSTSGLTTDTTANLLPANSLILAVTARVTTTITTATAWGLSDPTTANRFSAADTTLTAGEAVVGILQWSGAVTTAAAGPSQAAAAKVRVTATVSNPGAGAVRIGVLALVFSAPTS